MTAVANAMFATMATIPITIQRLVVRGIAIVLQSVVCVLRIKCAGQARIVACFERDYLRGPVVFIVADPGVPPRAVKGFRSR